MAELATTYAVALIRMHHALTPLRIPGTTSRPRPGGRAQNPPPDDPAEADAEAIIRVIDDVLASLELTNEQMDRARAILAEGLQRESDERQAGGGWWP